MSDEQRAGDEISSERSRRTTLAFGLQLPGLLVVGLVLFFVGLGKITSGQDVAMWVSILVGYLLAAAVAAWLMRRAVAAARD